MAGIILDTEYIGTVQMDQVCDLMEPIFQRGQR